MFEHLWVLALFAASCHNDPRVLIKRLVAKVSQISSMRALYS